MLSFGTCIVAVIARNEVVIGADSLRRYENGDTAEVCKIRRAGNIVFACAGTSEGEADHTQLRFNVTEIVSKTIKSTEMSISDASNNIESELKTELSKYFSGLQSQDQKTKLLHHLGLQPIEVVLCGIENELAVLSARKFGLKPPFNKIDFDITAVDYSGASLPLGETHEHMIGGYMTIVFADIPSRQNLEALKKSGDFVSYVRESISIAIKHDQLTKARWIGPPIRIVRITKTGAMLEE